MASFYDDEARRTGIRPTASIAPAIAQRVPLLTVSCGCAMLLAGSHNVNLDTLSTMLAELKKKAKASPAKLVLDYAGTITV